MQIDCSMPADLFSFESPVEKQCWNETEVRHWTPVSDTIFHIFLICVMLLITSGN